VFSVKYELRVKKRLSVKNVSTSSSINVKETWIVSLAAYDISMVVSESVAQVWNRLGTWVISGFRRKID
jgi:hypothetical protein